MIIKKGDKEFTLTSLIRDSGYCNNFHEGLKDSLISAIVLGNASVLSVKKISTITIIKLKWLGMDFSITCGSRTSIRVLSAIPSQEYLYEVLKI